MRYRQSDEALATTVNLSLNLPARIDMKLYFPRNGSLIVRAGDAVTIEEHAQIPG